MADQAPQTAPRSPQLVRAATAITIGGSLLVLSGLTLTVTVIGLTVATPLLVIFSPVLVPAVITVFLILAGFLSSGGLGVAALSVLSWIYKYLTGKHPVGAEKLDEVQRRVGSKTRDVKEHLGQQLQHQTQQSGQAS